MESVTIRRATVDDLDALKALPFSAGLSSKHFDRLARQRAGSVSYLVAVLGGNIVGHVLLRWDGPDAPSVDEQIGPLPQIEDFVVDPAYRGHGIGTRLLEECAVLAKDAGWSRIGLAVGHENHQARALYERRGFREVPGSAHRVTWPEIGPDGLERIGSEDCTYLVKELG
jgi:ribosomal protein S18 acetylase RimI-like enzyme